MVTNAVEYIAINIEKKQLSDGLLVLLLLQLSTAATTTTTTTTTTESVERFFLLLNVSQDFEGYHIVRD